MLVAGWVLLGLSLVLAQSNQSPKWGCTNLPIVRTIVGREVQRNYRSDVGSTDRCANGAAAVCTDSDSVVSFSTGALPAGLSFNNGLLMGRATTASSVVFAAKLTCSDADHETDAFVQIYVSANHPPAKRQSIGPQFLKETEALNRGIGIIPSQYFTDVDGDPLDFQWSFSPQLFDSGFVVGADHVLRGQATEVDKQAGTIQVTLTATDPGSAAADLSFAITISRYPKCLPFPVGTTVREGDTSFSLALASYCERYGTGPLEWSLRSLSGFSIDETKGIIKGLPTAADVARGIVTLKVGVSFGELLLERDLDLQVEADPAPVMLMEFETRELVVGKPVFGTSWNMNSYFYDARGDALTFTWVPGYLPAGSTLVLDPLGLISGAASKEDLDQQEASGRVLGIQAADPSGQWVQGYFILRVVPANTAPVARGGIDSASLPPVIIDAMFGPFDISPWFVDPDQGEQLEYSVHGIPAGSQLTLVGSTLQGLATHFQLGTPYQLLFTATDKAGMQASLALLAVARTLPVVTPPSTAVPRGFRAQEWTFSAAEYFTYAGQLKYTLTFAGGDSLSIDGNTGVASGVFKATDKSGQVTIQACGTLCTACCADLAFLLSVNDATAVTVDNVAFSKLPLPPWVVGAEWNVDMAPYFMSAAAFCGYEITYLPSNSGLAISSSGRITGRLSGSFLGKSVNPVVEVTGCNGGVGRLSLKGPHTVIAPTTPQSTMPAPPTASCGVNYTYNFKQHFIHPRKESLTYTLTGLLAEGSGFKFEEGVLNGKPTFEDVQAAGTWGLALTVSADDGQLGIKSIQAKLRVEGNSGIVARAVPLQQAVVNSEFRFNVADFVTDADATDVLLYSMRPVSAASGLSINTTTGVISGKPSHTDFGQNTQPVTVRITISDQSSCGGPSVIDVNFQLNIKKNNRKPIFDPLPAATACRGESLSLALQDYFSDPDNERLTFKATGLPLNTGLSMSSSGLLSGVLRASDISVNPHLLSITAEDAAGESVSAFLSLSVGTGNSPPVMNPPLQRVMQALQGQAFPVQLAQYFEDPDGHPLVYSISGLPLGSGLHVDRHGVFSGMPNAEDALASPIEITVSVTDVPPVVGVSSNPCMSTMGYETKFQIQVGRGGNLPPVSQGIPAERNCQGEPYQRDLVNFFHDPEEDALVFMLRTPLPVGSGLSLSRRGVFGGRSTLADVAASPLNLLIMAQDAAGSQATTTLVLVIEAAPCGVTVPTLSPTAAPTDTMPYTFPPSPPRTIPPFHAGNDDAEAFPPQLLTPNKEYRLDFSHYCPSASTFRMDGTPAGSGLTMSNLGVISGVPTYSDLIAAQLHSLEVSLVGFDSRGNQLCTRVLPFQLPRGTGGDAPLPTYNRCPVVNSIAAASGSVGTLFYYDISHSFTDPEGDPLTFRMTGLPVGSGLVMDLKTGIISGIPDHVDCSAPQPLRLVVEVHDSLCHTPVRTSVSVAIKCGEAQPILNCGVLPPAVAVQGSTFRFAVNAAFQFSGLPGSLRYTATELPQGTGLFITPDGIITGVPTDADCRAPQPLAARIVVDNRVTIIECERPTIAYISVICGLTPPGEGQAPPTPQWAWQPQTPPTPQWPAFPKFWPTYPPPGSVVVGGGMAGGPCGCGTVKLPEQFATPGVSVQSDLARFFCSSYGTVFHLEGLPYGSGLSLTTAGRLVGVPTQSDCRFSPLALTVTAQSPGGRCQAVLFVSLQCGGAAPGTGQIGGGWTLDPYSTTQSDPVRSPSNPVAQVPFNGYIPTSGTTANAYTNPTPATGGGVDIVSVPGIARPTESFYYDASVHFVRAARFGLVRYGLEDLAPASGFKINQYGILGGGPSVVDCEMASNTRLPLRVIAVDGAQQTSRVTLLVMVDCRGTAPIRLPTPAPSPASFTTNPGQVASATTSVSLGGGRPNIDINEWINGASTAKSPTARLNASPTRRPTPRSSGSFGAPTRPPTQFRSTPTRLPTRPPTLIAAGGTGQMPSSKGVSSATKDVESSSSFSPGQPASAGQSIEFDAATLPFARADTDEVIDLDLRSQHFSLAGLPAGSGFRIDASGFISGQPTEEDCRTAQPLIITVVATHTRTGVEAYAPLSMTIQCMSLVRQAGGTRLSLGSIAPTNRPPVLSSELPRIAITLGELMLFDLTRYFIDPDLADQLAFYAVDDGGWDVNPAAFASEDLAHALGLSTPSGLSLGKYSGIISGIPTLATLRAKQPLSLTLVAQDQRGESVQATLSLRVGRGVQANRVPVYVKLGVQQAYQGGPFSLDVGEHFSDGDGDALSFFSLGLSRGTGLRLHPQTGILQGTPTMADSFRQQPVAISVIADDGRGGVAEGLFHIHMHASASTQRPGPSSSMYPPMATDTPFPTVRLRVGEHTYVDSAVHFTDLDEDVLTYTLVGLSDLSGLHIDLNTGVISGIANQMDATEPGFPAAVTVIATEESGKSAEKTFFLQVDPRAMALGADVSNDSPLASIIPTASAQQGRPLLLGLSTSFSDPNGDRLTYTVHGLPQGSGLVVDRVSGILSGTPSLQAAMSQQPLQLTVSVSDGRGGQASSLLLLTVQPGPRLSNRPPITVGPFPALTAAQGEVMLVDLSLYFSDPDRDALSFTVVGLPQGSGLSIQLQTGIFTGTPTLADERSLPVHITVVAEDASGATAEAVFALSISRESANHSPLARPLPQQTATVGLPFSVDASEFFVDPDQDTLTYSLWGLPTNTGIRIDASSGFIFGTALRADLAARQPIVVGVAVDDGRGGKAGEVMNLLILPGESPTVRESTRGFAKDFANSGRLMATASSHYVLGDWALIDLLELFPEFPDAVVEKLGLRWNVVGLPINSGLSVNQTSGVLSGVVSTADVLSVQPMVLSITAGVEEAGHDLLAEQDQDALRLDIVLYITAELDRGLENRAPVAMEDIQGVIQRDAFLLLDASRSFVDPDHEDLTFKIKGLASSSGFHIVSRSGIVFGSPSQADLNAAVVSGPDASIVKFSVEAIDPHGAKALLRVLLVVQGSQATAPIDQGPRMKLCPELGWVNGTGEVCASAKLKGRCAVLMGWKAASDACSQLGARLCSAQELMQGAATGVGCDLEAKRVWTSSECPFNNEVLSQGLLMSSLVGVPAQCTAKSTALPVVCCATHQPRGQGPDSTSLLISPMSPPKHAVIPKRGSNKKQRKPNSDNQPNSEPQSKPKPTKKSPKKKSKDEGQIKASVVGGDMGPRGGPSDRTCFELEWTIPSSSLLHSVCAHVPSMESKAKSKQKKQGNGKQKQLLNSARTSCGISSYPAARQLCEDEGGRLCTSRELDQGVGVGMGCANTMVWTTSTTTCLQDQMVAQLVNKDGRKGSGKGGKGSSLCSSPSQLHGVLCCADEDQGAEFRDVTLELGDSHVDGNTNRATIKAWLLWKWAAYRFAQVSYRPAGEFKWTTPPHAKMVAANIGGVFSLTLEALALNLSYEFRITPHKIDGVLSYAVPSQERVVLLTTQRPSKS